MILRELKTGTELSIVNVSEFAFNKNGRYLALVIDAADQICNGIQIRDMQSGAITPLETSASFYELMAWAEEVDALVLLKGNDDRHYRERLLVVTSPGSAAAHEEDRVRSMTTRRSRPACRSAAPSAAVD